MEEGEFVEIKNKKLSNTQKRAAKHKYKNDAEKFWENKKVEHEKKADEKYDNANLNTVRDENYNKNKKIAIDRAMKNFQDKKDKIIEDYINSRIEDDFYLNDIKEENITEKKKINVESVNIYEKLNEI